MIRGCFLRQTPREPQKASTLTRPHTRKSSLRSGTLCADSSRGSTSPQTRLTWRNSSPRTLAPAEMQMPKGMEVAIRWAFGLVTRRQVEQIRTREDLDKVLQTIREATEVAPTMVRGALKQVSVICLGEAVPAGRPNSTPRSRQRFAGRSSKFELVENYSHKKALQETSALCLALIGKTVGTRTLDKAWSKEG